MDFKSAITQANEMLGKNQPAALTAGQLAPFLESEEAARGFFVALLTGESAGSQTPDALVEALRDDRSIAHSVLVRNLVMSSATEAAHRRSGDEEKAWGSAAVVERSGDLIVAVDNSPLWTMLSDMRKTLLSESDAFAEFLSRMNYSDDEKLAALTAVNHVLGRRKSHNVQILDLADPIE
jgi:hypothetical protein